MLDHFVQAARSANCSWAQIGEVLGVTKQAAQQRHGRWQPRSVPDLMKGLRGRLGKRSGLFQHFTPRARNVVVDAQEAARSFAHDHVGTEHVLLGLVSNPDSLGAKALARWKLTREDVLQEIEQRVGRGDPGTAPKHIRFDAPAKKSLELALREALQLGHNYIGTEHELLGIVRADGGLGATILRDRGITPDEVRVAVLDEIQALEDDKDED
jgi:ATP-dependent Clp protease ATP-binding subunit ClpA